MPEDVLQAEVKEPRKLRFKTYKEKVPVNLGDKPEKTVIQYNPDKERKGALTMLGFDPDSTDEQLEGYKTSFVGAFSEALSEEAEENDIPVKEYLENELKIKEGEIKHVNTILEEEYDHRIKRWEEGGVAVRTDYIPSETAEEKIAEIEGSDNFLEWVDEYEIDELLPVDMGEYEILSYKVGELYVLVNDSAFVEEADYETFVESALKYSGSQPERVKEQDVPVGDNNNVISLYQFYQLLDHNKDVPQELIGKIIDRDLSPEQSTQVADAHMFNDGYQSNENILENDELKDNIADKFSDILGDL